MFKSLSTSLIARGIAALAVGVIALAWPGTVAGDLVSFGPAGPGGRHRRRSERLQLPEGSFVAGAGAAQR
jgi:hypothetical protein